MKTPREVLLERHREAGPRLDEVRRKALAALQTARSAEKLELDRQAEGFKSRIAWRINGGVARWVPAMARKIWMELIWPSRRAWRANSSLRRVSSFSASSSSSRAASHSSRVPVL